MEKIESEELKAYLKRFVIKKLETNKLFVSTYGKGFATRSLDLYLDKVYISEYNKEWRGAHCSSDSSITISTPKDYVFPLTVKDIQNNSSLRATLLHEAIHAILTRSKT